MGFGVTGSSSVDLDHESMLTQCTAAGHPRHRARHGFEREPDPRPASILMTSNWSRTGGVCGRSCDVRALPPKISASSMCSRAAAAGAIALKLMVIR